MSPKAVLILLPLLAGSVFALRVLGLRRPLFFLPVGLAIGWVATLMAANLFLRAGIPLDGAFSLAFACLGGAGLLGLVKLPKLDLSPPRLSVTGWLYLVFGCGAVWFTSTTILFLNPDDDFWIHAPMQAQLLQGNFPISNPFFPSLPYGGHYARDLLSVLASWTTGADLYACGIPVTGVLQITAFLLLFLSGYRHGGGEKAGILVSLFIFTGVNAGGRGGWLDTLANNTALANMHTALLLFLLLRALFEEVGAVEVGVTGALYAGLGWAYETNFVSLSLGLLLLALLTLLKGRLKMRQLQVTAGLVGVALVFLVLQGGALGGLIVEKFTGSDQERQAPLDERVRAQNLEVPVSFPKERLFQINLARGAEDLSLAYLTVPGVKDLKLSSRPPGYVSIFTPTVWRIHWLAFYLFPLSFLYLWRRFEPLGLALWSYGFASFLLPAVVDFGVWEVEVFRWQFAASWGFAGALGCALALWWERTPGRALRVESGRLVLGRRAAVLAAIALITYFNSYPSWDQAKRRTSLLPSLQDGWRVPSTREWLAFHPALGMTEADIEVGRWLFERAEAGDRFLMNFREENYSNMLVEDAFVGLTGVQPTGHSLPLTYERVGTPPFRRDAVARAYWATGEQDLLRNHPPRWLYYRPDAPGVRPRPTEQVALVRSASSELGSRYLYRVDLEPFPVGRAGETPWPLRIVSLDGTQGLPAERYREIELRVRNLSAEPLQGVHYLTYSFPGHPTEEGLTQTVPLDLPPGGETSLPIHFVSPHHEGEYQVAFSLGDGRVERPLGAVPLTVRGSEPFLALQVEPAGPLPSLLPEMLTTIPFTFTNPGSEPIQFDGLAGLVAGGGGRTPPLANDFQPLAFRLEPGESRRVELALVPPAEAGAWPLELTLSRRDAVLVYRLGPGE